ncbi:MAG: hypothetical protein IJO92_02175 [Clostridia bacterium]|nr:hypothetical protein [Clostridia bacterium]MBR4087529.1 hypothetical protein [Clostridia bacterium]
MKNNTQTLHTIALNIEQTLRLLTCFEDFCDFEGSLENCKTDEEKQIKAIVFAERITQYESLIFASKELLNDALNVIT